MASTVIGLFDEAGDARRAVQELTAAGFDRDRIDATAAEASGADEGRDGETYGDGGFTDQIGDFFTSRFGHDDRASAGRYSEAMGGGTTLVTVHADSRDEAERAAGVLDAAGAIDVDERAARYRAGGATDTAAAGRAEGRAAIPVVEEELQVGKRVVEEVAVGKEIEEQADTVRDTVRSTDVDCGARRDRHEKARRGVGPLVAGRAQDTAARKSEPRRAGGFAVRRPRARQESYDELTVSTNGSLARGAGAGVECELFPEVSRPDF